MASDMQPLDDRYLVSVYEADAEPPGLIAGLQEFARNIWAYRSPIWMVFQRRLGATFRGSVLGMAWAIILPIVPISVYLFLRLVLTERGASELHPAVYVSVGATIWYILAGAVRCPVAGATVHRATLVRSRFPLGGAALIEFAGEIVDTLIRAAFALPFIFWLADVSVVGALLFFPLLVIAVMFALSIGIFLSIWRLVVPDLVNIMDIALRYLIFLRLVIFPLPAAEWAEWLALLNPFAVFVDNLRSILIAGTFSNGYAFATLAALSVALFFGACYFLQVSESRIRGFL